MQFIKTASRSRFIISSSIATVIVFSLYLFILISDSNSSADKVKHIYFVDNISPAHKKVIDLFNQKYKGSIQVESIDLPFSKFSTNERKELFARYLRSKSEQIDVFSVDQIWLPRFARWCEPLDKYLSAEEKETILPNVLHACYYNDTLVAVPLFVDIGLMYYRKDLIGKLPDAAVIEHALKNSISWEEFVSLGKRFRKEKNPFYIFQADNYEGLMCCFNEMLEGLQKPMYNNDSLFLQSPEAVKSLTLLVDLVHRYKLSPPGVTHFKEMDSYEYFLNHNGVFLRGWPNFLRDYESVYGATGLAKEIGKAPLPHFTGHPTASTMGGWNLMLSKYSVQKREAMIFIKFLMSEEAQKLMYEEGGYVPSNSALYADAGYLQQYPDLKFYQQLFSEGVQRPAHPEYTKISDIISGYLKQSINKTMTPKEALARAEAQIRIEGVFEK